MKLTTLLFVFISTLGFTQASTDLIGKDSINQSLLSSLIVDIINNERSKLNIHTLEIDEGAMEFSKYHAIWMTRNEFKHSNHSKYVECISSCFIASILTYTETANAIVNLWKKSPPHWKALMEPYYTKCGTYSAEYQGNGLVLGFSVMNTFTLSK